MRCNLENDVEASSSGEQASSGGGATRVTVNVEYAGISIGFKVLQKHWCFRERLLAQSFS